MNNEDGAVLTPEVGGGLKSLNAPFYNCLGEGDVVVSWWLRVG